MQTAIASLYGPDKQSSFPYLTTMQDSAGADCKTVGFQAFLLRFPSHALLARGMQRLL